MGNLLRERRREDKRSVSALGNPEVREAYARYPATRRCTTWPSLLRLDLEGGRGSLIVSAGTGAEDPRSGVQGLYGRSPVDLPRHDRRCE